jgi:hypothetical protein
MKTLRCVLGCALSVLACATGAQAGASANGDFSFALDESAGSIQFDARDQNDGRTRGQMMFQASMNIPDEDVDGTGDGVRAVSDLALGIAFDCLAVEGNRAAMSGVVVTSNVDGYTGRRAVLVVEDNPEGSKARDLDKFTWGVYPRHEMTWIPADAELERDDGAMLTWTATDAEREDDVGVPSTHGFPVIDCVSFSMDAYTMVDIPHGAGNVQVRP